MSAGGVLTRVTDSIRSFRSDFSGQAAVAAVVVVLISYTGPFAVVIQAGAAGHLPTETFLSWVWSISVASGITGILLSLAYRAPVVTAWSTPAAALLVTALPTLTWSDAVGTFVFAALAVLVIGSIGFLDKLVRWIPPPIASALLAGILIRFGLDAFAAGNSSPAAVAAVLLAYLIARYFSPRFAVAIALGVGLLIGLTTGTSVAPVNAQTVISPELTWPTFSASAIIGLGIPMVIVTLSGQYIPGITMLREAGYVVPARPLTSVLGAASLIFAPFGAHALNPAAITMAICAGPEAHPDKDRRYVASVLVGVLYIAVGIFGGALLALLAFVPPFLIAVVAGLALLTTISSSLLTSLSDVRLREPATITFLVTASGVQVMGIASAFWGLAAGGLAVSLSRKPQ